MRIYANFRVFSYFSKLKIDTVKLASYHGWLENYIVHHEEKIVDISHRTCNNIEHTVISDDVQLTDNERNAIL